MQCCEIKEENENFKKVVMKQDKRILMLEKRVKKKNIIIKGIKVKKDEEIKYKIQEVI